MPFVQSMKQSDQRRLIEILNESVTDAEMEARIRVFNHRHQTSASPTVCPPPALVFSPLLDAAFCLGKSLMKFFFFACRHLLCGCAALVSESVRVRVSACVCVALIPAFVGLISRQVTSLPSPCSLLPMHPFGQLCHTFFSGDSHDGTLRKWMFS